MDFSQLPDEVKRQIESRMIIGDPDTVAERVQNDLVDRGLPGLTFNLPATWQDAELVALTVETLKPLFS